MTLYVTPVIPCRRHHRFIQACKFCVQRQQIRGDFEQELYTPFALAHSTLYNPHLPNMTLRDGPPLPLTATSIRALQNPAI